MESRETSDLFKKLFIISPIGKEGTETRKRSDQVKQHVIDEASKFFGYKAIRSDKMFEPGLIPDQIVELLEDSELVIADLTEKNANIFYELAIRQVCGLPVILLCHEEDKAPFDVQSQRIIFYNHKDWDSLPKTLECLKNSIKTIEESDFKYDTPIKLKTFQDMMKKNKEIEELKKIIDETKKNIVYMENKNTNLEINIQNLRNELKKSVEVRSNLDDKKIRIGYISPTTTGLEIGLPLVKQIIEPDINRYVKSLGYNVEFEFLIDDARGQAAVHLEKVQAFHSMGVNLILGGGWSSQASASLSYCNDNNIILFSSSSTSPLLAIPNDNLFRMCPTDLVQAPAISQMILSYGISKLVILQRGDAWADGIYNDFSKIFEESGGVILKRIRYAPEATNFENYLQDASKIIQAAEIAATNVEIGVLVLSFSEIASILLQAEKFKHLYNVKWFGSDGTALTQQLIDDASRQCDKVKIFSTLAAPPESQKFKSIYDRYYSLISQPFGYYSACLYDAAWAVVKSVLEAQSTETSDVKKVLPKICYDMWGASGWCALNDAGDRAFSNYQIWGYGRMNEGPVQSIVYGIYDGTTGEVKWRKEAFEN